MTRIVVTHHNADLDALACLVAAAKLYGATPVIPSFVNPAVRRYLALHKDHLGVISIAEVEPPSFVAVVDVRDGRRLKDTAKFIDGAERVVVWDHHPASAFDVRADEVHIEPVGACITLLMEALLEAQLEISSEDATLFLLGIYSDTGRLSYASTQPRDAKIAAWLLAHGANLRVASRYLRREYSPDQLMLMKQLIASDEEISVSRIEIAFCSAVMPRYVDGASIVVHQVMEFGGHDVMIGILYFEKNDRIQVIARSRVSHVDVGQLMREIGGGGHHGAAAATFKNTSIAAVRAQIESLLRASPLAATRVRDLMSTPVLTFDVSQTLEHAKSQLQIHGHSGAPILRDNELVGILSRRDIARAERAASLQLPVSSHMTHHVECIDPDEPVEDALDLMTERDVGRLPVVRNSELLGILTRSDVLVHLYLTALDDSDLTTG